MPVYSSLSSSKTLRKGWWTAGISSKAARVRAGDRALLREKRAIKVMEAQSQFPGHIVEVADTAAAVPAAAGTVARPSGSCCWKRKGCETHLSKSRELLLFLPVGLGPGSVSREGREVCPWPGLQDYLLLQLRQLRSLLLWFCHTRRWESHMSLFTGRGSCPAAGFLLQHPTPTPTR